MLPPRGDRSIDPLLTASRAAEAEAVRAYEQWRRSHSGEDHVAYRACATRADPAQDALAAARPA